MILPLQLMFLAIIASAQICQPANSRQGYFSQYNKSPTDGTITYHQNESGRLPQDMSSYVGVIAVRDCGLVGDDAWIRITDERTNPDYAGFWLPVKIFDCSGHVETTEWMDENNILGELGYYLANDLNIYGEGQVRGEMILEAPADIEMICEPSEEEMTPIPIYVPQGTLTIPQMLTQEVAPTTTPTATPAPLPTAAIIWRKVTSSARAIAMMATPPKTSGPSETSALPILNVQGADTAFDAYENLPAILAGFVFIMWIGFGLLMFLLGRASSRSAGIADRRLTEVLVDLANLLQTQPLLSRDADRAQDDG